jgi:drug/metabolite transporter (DMT)-like permease
VSTRAWAGFAAVSVLFGIPYLFIKIAVDGGLSPAFVAWSRVLLGAAILLALSHRAGLLRDLGDRWRWLAAYAIVEIAIPFPLIGEGERHIDSSLAAIIIAAVPLLIALLALRFDHSERVTGTRLAGLLIGFTGVIVLVGIDVAGRRDELLGAAAVFVAACGYAAGPMILRAKLADLDARVVMGVSLAIAALALTPLTALSPPREAPTGDAVLAVVVLGLLCTSLAFVVFGRLIAEIGPSRALVVTYVNPVVALALGIAVLGERPGAGAVAGLLLILAGSWLSTDGRLPPGLRSAKGERVRADARVEAEGHPMRARLPEAHEGVQPLGADRERPQRPAVEPDVHRPRPATA